MSTFLFDNIIFGPIISRRLGVSLGVNLLPVDSKSCTFDCIYCECGWNPEKTGKSLVLPQRSEVMSQLKQKLLYLNRKAALPDVITFAGNGEPTLHPDFEGIIDDTILLRNELAPKSKIAVLSNATMLHRPSVIAALIKVEDNIQKLDSAIPETVQIMNQPLTKFDLPQLILQMKKFDHQLIIQTMFLKGEYCGQEVDNTTDREISAWIEVLKEIRPETVMIYSIARDTPAKTIERIDLNQLKKIAKRVELETQIPVQVSG